MKRDFRRTINGRFSPMQRTRGAMTRESEGEHLIEYQNSPQSPPTPEPHEDAGAVAVQVAVSLDPLTAGRGESSRACMRGGGGYDTPGTPHREDDDDDHTFRGNFRGVKTMDQVKRDEEYEGGEYEDAGGGGDLRELRAVVEQLAEDVRRVAEKQDQIEEIVAPMMRS